MFPQHKHTQTKHGVVNMINKPTIRDNIAHKSSLTFTGADFIPRLMI